MQDHHSRIHHDGVHTDHGEGDTPSLSLIFSSDLKSSLDPPKGYGETFADFIARTQDRNDVRPDGSTVMIDPSGKSVARGY